MNEPLIAPMVAIERTFEGWDIEVCKAINLDPEATHMFRRKLIHRPTGRQIETTWSPEVAEDLCAFHGNQALAGLGKALVDEIFGHLTKRTEEPMSAPLMTPMEATMKAFDAWDIVIVDYPEEHRKKLVHGPTGHEVKFNWTPLVEGDLKNPVGDPNGSDIGSVVLGIVFEMLTTPRSDDE